MALEVQLFYFERAEMPRANIELCEFLHDLQTWGAEVKFVQQSQTYELMVISIWFEIPRE